MAVMTRTSKKSGTMRKPDERVIVAALRKLPPDYLPEVLRYIEFLDYKVNGARADAVEKAALWAAVEANQEYKQKHPDEYLEIHETKADFLNAMANL